MFKVHDLRNKVNSRQEDYRNGKSRYASPPKPLFKENGEFNHSNWNGGDDIIRQFTNWLEYKVEGGKFTRRFHINSDDGHYYEGYLMASYAWVDDTNYVQITIKYERESIDEYYPYEYKTYLIEYYKNRGKTDAVLVNGNYANVYEYLFLLNVIEESGFNFD